MILHEIPHPDAEILVSVGEAAEKGEKLISYIPFNRESWGIEKDFLLNVFRVYQSLQKAYQQWPYEYINIELRFNHDYINI